MRPAWALAAAACLTHVLAFSLSDLGSSVTLDIHPPHEPAADGTPYPGTALFTDSVTYCAEAKAVLIDQFDIAYWGYNQSVTFAFSFASVLPDLNAKARLYFNAYGMELFNETVNLCDLISGVLCPLPMVNFTGECFVALRLARLANPRLRYISPRRRHLRQDPKHRLDSAQH